MKNKLTYDERWGQIHNIRKEIEQMNEGDSITLRSKWNGQYYILILIEHRGDRFTYRKDRIGARNNIIKNLGVDDYISSFMPSVLYYQIEGLKTKYTIEKY
jgi:hypothetical protein